MTMISKLLLCVLCSTCFVTIGFTAQRVVVCELIVELW